MRSSNLKQFIFVNQLKKLMRFKSILHIQSCGCKTSRTRLTLIRRNLSVMMTSSFSDFDSLNMLNIDRGNKCLFGTRIIFQAFLISVLIRSVLEYFSFAFETVKIVHCIGDRNAKPIV